MIPRVKYQHLTYTVTSANQQIIIDAETDKLYNTCTGINDLLTNETAKFGAVKLDINGVEVFPEKFEVLRIMFRAHAPFGFDYHRLQEPAGGSKIKGTFTDNGQAIYPYDITFSFRLENTETSDTGSVN